jgi:hypothetical protein
MAFLLVGVFVAGSMTSAAVYNAYTYLTTPTPPTAPEPPIQPSPSVLRPIKTQRPTPRIESTELFDNELRLALLRRRGCVSPGC